jgi:hypothetical protein
MKVNLAVRIDRSVSKTHSDALSCRARENTGVASHSPEIRREITRHVLKMWGLAANNNHFSSFFLSSLLI